VKKQVKKDLEDAINASKQAKALLKAAEKAN